MYGFYFSALECHICLFLSSFELESTEQKLIFCFLILRLILSKAKLATTLQMVTMISQ